MSTRADISELSLADVSRAVASGDVSPVELTEHFLARIEETEPDLNAYVTVTADRARADAVRAQDELAHGRRRGPLHGLPFGVKDLVDTAGIRTTYGSPRFAEHVPHQDAEVVERLREAGVVLLGKQATHELAWGGRTDSATFGPTHNPYRRGHVPGGSSGGSAASVRVGSALAAVGSDTAGSVRIPAALSGCVGFKPSRDRIGMRGVLPLAPSLDHLGVLTRTVEDAALVVDTIAPGPAGPAVRDIRFGWLGGWFAEVLSPGVREVLESARRDIEDAGMTVEDVDVPDQEEVTEALLTRILAEAGDFHRRAFTAQPQLFGADVAGLMRLPSPTRARRARAEEVTSRFGRTLEQALQDVDVLFCATVPVTAPVIGDMTLDVAGRTWPVELVLTRLTSPFNVTGMPAVSVPIGLDGGLPVGLQVIAARHQDYLALAGARVVEQAVPELPRPRLSGYAREGRA